MISSCPCANGRHDECVGCPCQHKVDKPEVCGDTQKFSGKVFTCRQKKGHEGLHDWAPE